MKLKNHFDLKERGCEDKNLKPIAKEFNINYQQLFLNTAKIGLLGQCLLSSVIMGHHGKIKLEWSLT